MLVKAKFLFLYWLKRSLDGAEDDFELDFLVKDHSVVEMVDSCVMRTIRLSVVDFSLLIP